MAIKILAGEVPFIGILLINSLNFVLNFQQWRYWRRIEQRRIATVRGDRSLLANEQPVANAAALALPCTFTLGYKLRPMARLIALIWVFFFLYCGFLGWWVTVVCSGYQITFPSPLLIGGTFVAACVIALLPVLLMRSQHHVVEVSEVGIEMNMGRQHSFVRWQDARLFAVYYSLGAQRNQSSLTYELSSMTDIVRWTDIVHHSSAILPQMTPTIPLTQYQQQIQDLNALVVARTGLPLSDLC
ncbi:hypothetical protein KDH_22080 [Dictyobacter sp. S3.2.2.5]|uniref:DUF304 domain-containing protein n=1 Tax=Dictyobacter halimunensis TaxID=3026934 RepID=A0ABQ6FMC2_9CHLR|nr:hypothetical protein KDH_22080 [Dictyobacter sp. S3.2.2.5]